MSIRRLAFVVGFVVAGCAAAPSSPAPATATATSITPATTSAPQLSTVEETTAFPTTKPGLPVVLTGTPEAGVEAGCLILDGYLLVGGPRELLMSGQQLAVTGSPDPSLMTTCQQGTPLMVDSAELVGRTTT